MSANKTTPPLARYTDKEPTELQKRFVAWIEEKTGYAPDEKSVALSVALRMEFQRSPENQQHLENQRSAAAEAKAARVARPKKAAKPAAPAKRRRPAPEPDETVAAPGDELVNGEIVKEGDGRPEPMFEDEAADKAVEDAQKADEPKPAPKRRRSRATMLQG